MSLVHQDAAKRATAQLMGDAGLVPKASESQHLSLGMASLIGADAMESDIFYRAAPINSTPVTDGVSYAAMVNRPGATTTGQPETKTAPPQRVTPNHDLDLDINDPQIQQKVPKKVNRLNQNQDTQPRQQDNLI
jgi:hypothetical protein